MTTCTGCGATNGHGDDFCGGCSAFLDWGPAAAPLPTTVPDVPLQRPPVQTVRAAPAGATAWAGPQPASGRDVPTPDGGRLPEQRTPQAEEPRAAPRPTTALPTDVFCGACGAGNAEGRCFCRSCGAGLTDPVATLPVRIPWWTRWWRRVLGVVRRERPPLAAGERTASWRRSATPPGGTASRRSRWRLPDRLSLGALAIPLALLSLVGYGIAPVRAAVTTFAFDTYDSVRQVVAPRFVAVTPAGAAADSQVDGHGPLAAIDANTGTWWAEGREGAGPGAALTLTFETATDLARVGVHNGAAGPDFALQPRLRTLQVDLTDVSGQVSSSRLELEDTADFRTYDLTGTAVLQVRLTVVDVYAGQQGADAALTDVSFHTQR